MYIYIYISLLNISSDKIEVCIVIVSQLVTETALMFKVLTRMNSMQGHVTRTHELRLTKILNLN